METQRQSLHLCFLHSHERVGGKIKKGKLYLIQAGGYTSEGLVCTDVTLKSRVPFSFSSSSSSSSSIDEPSLCSSLWGHDRSSAVFHLPSASKRRPCLSSWLAVCSVIRLEAYTPPPPTHNHFLKLALSPCPRLSLCRSLPIWSLTILILFSFWVSALLNCHQG